MAKEEHNKVQGEGDRESAQKYNEKTREFVESDKMDEADPSGQSPEEADEAEARGKSKAKEYDPEVHRDYDKPTRD